MAVIKVETPEGIVQVEIAGDTPTQQELMMIQNQFFGNETVQPQDNLANISEIGEYSPDDLAKDDRLYQPIKNT